MENFIKRKIIRFVSLTAHINYFSRVDKIPNVFSLAAILPRLLFSKNICQNFRLIMRAYNANRLPVISTFSEESELPSLELLIVVEAKDFEILPFSLLNFVKNCKNPIHLITIIVPDHQLLKCRQVIRKFNLSIKWRVLPENQVINEDLRKLIQIEFKDRFGWVLQQFLKVIYILNLVKYSEKPLLILDADTIIIKETCWVNNAGKQILLQSIERNEPYYKFISKLPINILNENKSFVTHHMVYNPILFKNIFKLLNLDTFQKLFDFVIDNYDKNSASPFSIDYEVYGHFIYKYCQSEIEVLKFSNLAIDNVQNLVEFQNSRENKSYKSISIHSYLK